LYGEPEKTIEIISVVDLLYELVNSAIHLILNNELFLIGATVIKQYCHSLIIKSHSSSSMHVVHFCFLHWICCFWILLLIIYSIHLSTLNYTYCCFASR